MRTGNKLFSGWSGNIQHRADPVRQKVHGLYKRARDHQQPMRLELERKSTNESSPSAPLTKLSLSCVCLFFFQCSVQSLKSWGLRAFSIYREFNEKPLDIVFVFTVVLFVILKLYLLKYILVEKLLPTLLFSVV